MELSGVIQPHYVYFSEVVDPVSLASRLRSLTNDDRDVIQCRSRFCSRIEGVMKLHDVIIGKVKWPELYAALMKENLTVLAMKLEEEYYRQHPAARPIPQDENLNPQDENLNPQDENLNPQDENLNPQDENLNPGVDQLEQEPTESSSDDDVKENAGTNISFFGQACYNVSSSTKVSLDKLVKDGSPYVIVAQTVNLQYGDNNCMKINSTVEQEGPTAEAECAEEYVVCVSSESLDRSESLENTVNNDSPITVLYSRCPAEPSTPQNIRPQFSSSNSDSQDGSSPKVCCTDETAEHTSEKLVFQERNGGEMIYMAPSDNSPSHDNTNTESHGINGIDHVKMRFEDLGIALREDREKDEETELKKVT